MNNLSVPCAGAVGLNRPFIKADDLVRFDLEAPQSVGGRFVGRAAKLGEVQLRDPHEAFAEYEPIADRDEYGVCVTQIAAKSGLAQSTVSSYMTTLERVGLVTSARVGKWTHYKRNAEHVDRLVQDLRLHI